MRAHAGITALAVGVGLLALACEQAPTAADSAALDAPDIRAAVTSNTKTPFGPFLSFNSCTGELLEFTGIRHDQTRSTDDGAGGFHVAFHRNWQNLKAVGLTSGNEYTAQQIINNKVNAKPPFPFVSTTDRRLKFTSTGSDDNFISTVRTKLVVNANGEVTVSDVLVEVRCD